MHLTYKWLNFYFKTTCKFTNNYNDKMFELTTDSNNIFVVVTYLERGIALLK